MDSVPPGARPIRTGALGGDGPRGQDRLAAGPVVHREERPVQEQVVQLNLGQAAFGPRRELGLNRLTHPRNRRLAQRGLGTERVGQGRLHVTITEAADVPGDDQGLQRVGSGHARAEQAGGELLRRAAQLRALHRDRPGGGLDRGRAKPVPAAHAGVPRVGGALVAGAAQELLDLDLHGGLHDQPSAQARDLLQLLGKVDATPEQGIDLAADLLGGRYSYRQRT